MALQGLSAAAISLSTSEVRCGTGAQRAYDELLSSSKGELLAPRLQLQLLRSLLAILNAWAETAAGGAGGAGYARGAIASLCDRYAALASRLQAVQADKEAAAAGFQALRKKLLG